MQKTLILLKPDSVERGLIGKLISRFEDKWLKIVAMKMLELSGDLLKEHYAHLADKPFFPEIEEYMTTSPIVGMVLEWRDSIESIRTICWATNPVEAAPWTIRWDLSLTINGNLIHASDSEENAKEEIARFFKPEEVFSYTRGIDKMIG